MKNVGEWFGNAERQWRQRTTEDRKAKVGMDSKEGPRVDLLRFQFRRRTSFIRPGQVYYKQSFSPVFTVSTMHRVNLLFFHLSCHFMSLLSSDLSSSSLMMPGHHHPPT